MYQIYVNVNYNIMMTILNNANVNIIVKKKNKKIFKVYFNFMLILLKIIYQSLQFKLLLLHRQL